MNLMVCSSIEAGVEIVKKVHLTSTLDFDRQGEETHKLSRWIQIKLFNSSYLSVDYKSEGIEAQRWQAKAKHKY